MNIFYILVIILRLLKHIRIPLKTMSLNKALKHFLFSLVVQLFSKRDLRKIFCVKSVPTTSYVANY